MDSDPILREVHRMKDQCARQFDYDVAKIFEHLREQAKKHPERMVYPPTETLTRAKRRTATKKAAK
jgi:hypothetical protein